MKIESEMVSKEELERRWLEMVERSDKRVRSGLKGVKRKERVERRKERGVDRSYLSDLWLFVIMLVFWVGFVSFIEYFGL
jgi:hypothetical protein